LEKNVSVWSLSKPGAPRKKKCWSANPPLYRERFWFGSHAIVALLAHVRNNDDLSAFLPRVSGAVAPAHPARFGVSPNGARFNKSLADRSPALQFLPPVHFGSPGTAALGDPK
jgi:hypothetical protein